MDHQGGGRYRFKDRTHSRTCDEPRPHVVRRASPPAPFASVTNAEERQCPLQTGRRAPGAIPLDEGAKRGIVFL